MKVLSLGGRRVALKELRMSELPKTRWRLTYVAGIRCYGEAAIEGGNGPLEWTGWIVIWKGKMILVV